MTEERQKKLPPVSLNIVDSHGQVILPGDLVLVWIHGRCHHHDVFLALEEFAPRQHVSFYRAVYISGTQLVRRTVTFDGRVWRHNFGQWVELVNVRTSSWGQG